MARIPITDIPNAPGIGNPTLSPQLQHTRGVQALDVSGEALDGSGVQRTQSLLAGAGDDIRKGVNTVARATEGTERPLVDGRAEIASWNGAQDIAQAFQKSGAVIGEFAHAMSVADDANTMAQASIAMHEGFAAHADDIAQNKIPYTDYVKDWQEKKVPEIQKRLDALSVSPRIRQRLANDFAQFSSESTIQFGQSATQTHIATIGGNLLNASEVAFNNGHLEEAHTHLNEAVRVGALRQDQADGKWQGMVAKARDEQDATVIVQNPKAVIDDYKHFQETGKSELFPDRPTSKLISYNSAAQGQFRLNQRDAIASADESIASGEFETSEQIEKFGQDNELDRSDIQALQKSMTLTVAATPQAQAKYKASLNSLSSKVASYDPGDDPLGEQYRDLRNEIKTTAVKGDRKDFFDQLHQNLTDQKAGSSLVRKSLTDTVDQLQKQGLLIPGGTGMDSKGKSVTDWKQYSDVNAKAIELKQKAREIVKANPGASPAEINAKFQEVVSGDASANAAGAFGVKPASGSWFDWTFPGAMKRAGAAIFQSAPSIGSQIDQKIGPKPMSGLFNGTGKDAKVGTPQSSAIPDETINFIKNAEGFSAVPQPDYKQTSIGYGTRAKPGETAISKDQADARLKAELAQNAVNVDKAIAQSGIDLTPKQRAALISFDFNTGEGAHLISTSKDAEEIAARLPTWNKVTIKGKKIVNQGLVNRRAAEMALFNA